MIIFGLNKLTITKNSLSLRSFWFKSFDVMIGSAALRLAFGKHCREFQSEVLMNIANILNLMDYESNLRKGLKLNDFRDFTDALVKSVGQEICFF